MTDLTAEFNRLRDEWDEGTRFESSSTAIASHPALQEIIALGRPVVPHIIADWETAGETGPKHWFAALEAILGHSTSDMVSEENQGNIQEMADAWMRKWYQGECTWEERVRTGLLSGGISYTPNGLPIQCIRYDDFMTEGEHGWHDDYKLHIRAKYEGPAREDPYHEYGVEGMDVIYSDGTVVLAMYEYCYTIWRLRDGEFLGGFGFNKYWKLQEEDLVKIREQSAFMRETNTTANNLIDRMAEDRKTIRELRAAAEGLIASWNGPSGRDDQRQPAMDKLVAALKAVEEMPPVPHSLRHPHAKAT